MLFPSLAHHAMLRDPSAATISELTGIMTDEHWSNKAMKY